MEIETGKPTILIGITFAVATIEKYVRYREDKLYCVKQTIYPRYNCGLYKNIRSNLTD